MKFFPVTYLWTDADGEYEGHTVVSGPDAASALANFQRRNPHFREARIPQEHAEGTEAVA